MRSTVSDFLFNEWVSGAVLGDKPEGAKAAPNAGAKPATPGK